MSQYKVMDACSTSVTYSSNGIKYLTYHAIKDKILLQFVKITAVMVMIEKFHK
jgi:hypothetical protein